MLQKASCSTNTFLNGRLQDLLRLAEPKVQAANDDKEVESLIRNNLIPWFTQFGFLCVVLAS